MTNDERRREWEQRWVDTLRTCGDEEHALLQVALSALKEFPQDEQFLYRAAVDELRIAQGLPNDPQRMELLCTAIAHAQLCIEMDPEKRTAQWVLTEAKALRETCRNQTGE